LAKEAGESAEGWVFDWKKGWVKIKAEGGGEIQDKRISVLEFKEMLTHALIDGKIDQEEFKKQMEQGPPQGNKEPKGDQMTDTAGAMGAAALPQSADDKHNPWLGKSKKEIDNIVKYRKNNLRRIKNDSETPKSVLEKLQQMVEEAEAAQIAITPPEARLSQFDQQIVDAQWAKEEAEFIILEADANAKYWEERKTEGKEKLNTAIADLENLRKQKSDLMLKAGGKVNLGQTAQHLQLDESTFDIVQNLDVQNSPEDKEAYQMYLKLNEFFAKKHEQKAWEEQEETDSEEEESDDEDSARRGKGMTDIRHLTANLPTQASVAQGSEAGADPTAQMVFSQAQIDYLNKVAESQEAQGKIEQDQGRGKTADEKKNKKEKGEVKERKPKMLPLKKKEPVKPRAGKKETGTTPTKNDKEKDLALQPID